MMHRLSIQALIALLAFAPLGCSFYYSSESSGKTLASPSTSSASSSGGDDKQAYGDDIRDYTYAYVVSGHGLDAYEKGLGEVARRHGITNWEEDEATYVGIGEGLAKAQLSPKEIEAFERSVARDDHARMILIRRGYDARRSA